MINCVSGLPDLGGRCLHKSYVVHRLLIIIKIYMNEKLQT